MGDFYETREMALFYVILQNRAKHYHFTSFLKIAQNDAVLGDFQKCCKTTVFYAHFVALCEMHIFGPF